jgi:hypothetical protein
VWGDEVVTAGNGELLLERVVAELRKLKPDVAGCKWVVVMLALIIVPRPACLVSQVSNDVTPLVTGSAASLDFVILLLL